MLCMCRIYFHRKKIRRFLCIGKRTNNIQSMVQVLYTIIYQYKMSVLTLNLLTTTIVAPPSNGSKWQMGFNSAFKGLKHLKTLQHVSIIIQIIFRGLVGSLLKSLNLKVFISFFKLWRLFVVMRQHNVRCVCVA